MMKFFKYISFLMLLLFFRLGDLFAQMDGNCHVDVVSGSPVLFQLGTMDELNNGKTITYTSVVRAFFVKPIQKWTLHAKSVAPLFDGPSDIDVSTVRLQVKQLTMNSDLTLEPGSNDIYSYTNNGEMELRADDVVLCYGDVNPANYAIYKNYYLIFHVQFSLKADNSDAAKSFTDKISGYYASQAVFWMDYL